MKQLKVILKTIAIISLFTTVFIMSGCTLIGDSSKYALSDELGGLRYKTADLEKRIAALEKENVQLKLIERIGYYDTVLRSYTVSFKTRTLSNKSPWWIGVNSASGKKTEIYDASFDGKFIGDGQIKAETSQCTSVGKVKMDTGEIRSVQATDPSADKLLPITFTKRETIFDGEKVWDILHYKQGSEFHIRPIPESIYGHPFRAASSDPKYWLTFHGIPVGEFLKRDDVKVEPFQEELVNGEKCYRIRASWPLPETTEEVEFLINTKRGCRLQEIVIYYNDHWSASQIQLAQYSEDIWYPVRVNRKSFTGSAENPEILKEEEIEFSNFRGNIQIPERIFQPVPQKDSNILDHRQPPAISQYDGMKLEDILKNMGYDKSIVENPMLVKLFEATTNPSISVLYKDGRENVSLGWYQNDKEHQLIQSITFQHIQSFNPEFSMTFNPQKGGFGFYIGADFGKEYKWHTGLKKNNGKAHVKVFPTIQRGTQVKDSYLLYWENMPIVTNVIIRVDGVKPVTSEPFPIDLSRRPYLGVVLHEIEKGKVKVAEVMANSPAERAEIKVGDEIVAIDSEQILSFQMVVLEVARRKISDKIVLTILRDGNKIEVPVALGRMGIGENR